MKYPALRLYFRGSNTIIDIPNPFNRSFESLTELIQSGTFIPKVITGKDIRGNVIVAVITDYVTDIAFAAAIMVDDEKDAEHDRTLDRLNQNPN